MKFVILAATIGYVFGAATGEACRARTVAADPAAEVTWRGFCDSDTNDADPTTNDDGATTDCNTGVVSDSDSTAAQVCGAADSAAVAGVAEGAATGICYATVRAAAAIGSTTAAVDAIACTGTDTCEGEVTTAGSEADGVCTVAAADIADGADGGNCNAAADAVTACDTDLTVDQGADAADAGGDDFCKAASGGATALDANVAAGADGGAPRTASDAVAGDARCDGALVATITDDGADPAVETGCTCGAAATTAAPADDAPAAIFYGMSMVTAAVAYLL